MSQDLIRLHRHIIIGAALIALGLIALIWGCTR